jgi:hypothetical protein
MDWAAGDLVKVEKQFGAVAGLIASGGSWPARRRRGLWGNNSAVRFRPSASVFQTVKWFSSS